MLLQTLKNWNQSLSELFVPLLEGVEHQLQDWPDEEGSLLVLCMELSASVEPVQPSQSVTPLPVEVDNETEDDGVLPNQEAIAQELLYRVLIITGAIT